MEFEQFPRFKQFNGQTLLAVDYGQKVVGLATFCPGRDPFPTPFARIIYSSDQQVIEELKALIDDQAIDVVVLGIPYYTDGKSSEMTNLVKKFGKALESSISIPLFEQDEALTSYAAEERMKESPRYNFKVDMKQIDALAASIILEDFIKTSPVES